MGLTRKFINTVEAWFERVRSRRENPPPHDQTNQLVWTDRNATLHRLVTIGRWARDGSTPATCVACRNQHGLALTWMSGHESLARFQCCECDASWTDPLWANTSATECLLSNAHDLEWSDPSPWFSDEDLHMTIKEMRYEADADQRRRQQEEDGDQ